MRVHVTGAASFIGDVLLQHCRSSGLEVSGSDLSVSNQSGIVCADIRDSNFARFIPDDTEVLVHLAAVSREADCKGRMDDWYQTNVRASENVLRAASARGVSQLVFASSEWVYDYFGMEERTEQDSIDPMGVSSEYGLSKLLAESALLHAVAETGIDLTILRFGIVYGPRPNNWSAVEALLNAVRTQESVNVGSLETARRFIHVQDIADAIHASFGQTGAKVFNVQGPDLVSLGEVIRIAKLLSGKNPVVQESDPEYSSIRRVSSAAIAHEIKWRAKTTIEDGMKDIIAYMKDALHA